MKSVRTSHALHAAFCDYVLLRVCLLAAFAVASTLLSQSISSASMTISLRFQNSPVQFQPHPIIRVGLMHYQGCASIILRADPGAKLYSSDGTERASGIGPWTLIATSQGSTLLDSRGRATAQAGEGERWRLQAEIPETRLGISLPGSALHRYRGAIEICSRAQRLFLVNEISLESYLRGVVPAEMGGNSPLEALKAQAVASRTFAMYTLSQNNHSAPPTSLRKTRQAASYDSRSSIDYEIRDDTQAQVYSGADQESKASDLAVQDTSGWILTQAGNPIPAFYSSSCGGVTCPGASANSCPHSVDDSEAHGGTGLHLPDWTLTYTCEKLASILLKSSAVHGTGSVHSIIVAERDISGRVKRLNIQWDRANTPADANFPTSPEFADPDLASPANSLDTQPQISKNSAVEAKHPRQAGALTSEITGNTLRSLLGNDTLRSTLFEVRRGALGEIIIEGHGWGHGKGMCQIGAKALASLPVPKNYRMILLHYYEGAELTHIVYSEEDSLPDRAASSNRSSQEVVH